MTASAKQGAPDWQNQDAGQSGTMPVADANVEGAALRKRVLIVDDEPAIAALLARLLSKDNHTEASVHPAEAATRLLAGEEFDVVLCDLEMPGMSGIDLYEQVVARMPRMTNRFVFITGGAVTERARRFLSESSCACIDKPFDVTDVLRVVSATVSLREVERSGVSAVPEGVRRQREGQST